MTRFHIWSVGLVMICVITGCLFSGDGISIAAQPPERDVFGLLSEINAKLDQLNAKNTDLSGVTQNWSKVLPAVDRFVLLAAFSNLAVLDKSTGLVWERSPELPTNWIGARRICMTLNVGNIKGWRLPAIAELMTLVDPSVPTSPKLPPGHPFILQNTVFWSATQDANSEQFKAWSMAFSDGEGGDDSLKSDSKGAWCVRGPMQESTH